MEVYAHFLDVPLFHDIVVYPSFGRLRSVYDAAVSGTAVLSYHLQMYVHPRDVHTVYFLVLLLSGTYDAAVSGASVPSHALHVYAHTRVVCPCCSILLQSLPFVG